MAVRKAKKHNLSWHKKKAWDAFSVFIRTRDTHEGLVIRFGPCVTCGRNYDLKHLQAGHFIPGRRNVLLFDEEQVNAQCDSCNRHKRGAWPEYYEVMVQRHGTERVQEMIHGRNEIKILKIPDYMAITAEYREKTLALLQAPPSIFS